MLDRSPTTAPTTAPTAFHSLSFRGKLGYSESTFSMKRPTQSQQSQPRTYGGIVRTKLNDGTHRYALVQGRYTGKWSFPKGHALEGETPLECCEREIAEETSIDWLPLPTEYLKVCYGHYYIFDVKEEIPLVPRDINEIMDTKWVTLKEMENMPVNADVSMYLRGGRTPPPDPLF